MTIKVDAVYENGILRPNHALDLKEKQRVSITIETADSDLIARSYGLVGWKGDAKTVEHIALDPEYDLLEGP